MPQLLGRCRGLLILSLWFAAQPLNADLITYLRSAQAQIRGADPAEDVAQVGIEGGWEGPIWRGRLINRGQRAVRLDELVLADVSHQLDAETPIYGEGFTMLAQTGGTLAAPRDEGFYPDRSHYRIPEPEGLRTVYGVMTLQPAPESHMVLAFTSSRRFVGRFSFDASRLRVSYDLERLELAPGETWELEPLIVLTGPRRDELLARVAEELAGNHPPIHKQPVPTGWCSWYCFGPRVTTADIRGNLDWARDHFPQLRYIQIDDGYQPWMGDWLETGKSFGGDVRAVIREIQELGFEPAIWAAPFVASPESTLFQQHPDWFVQDASGRPLRSDEVGFGGWRLGPWYVLDGTHPEALGFLEDLFRTLRQEWGCTYFKLDATYWGAIHGGRRHDPRATRVEAYRRGMAAIRRGAGEAFLLGCNHPIWPSAGLIHGSRSSMDIQRDWRHVLKTGRENLLRGWQNGRLWWNDPDCLVLNHNGRSGPSEFDDRGFLFHATLMYATGGMLLTGDDMRTYGAIETSRLHKVYPPSGRCMEFADTQFRIGRLVREQDEIVAVFNWDEEPASVEITLNHGSRIVDFWSDEDLGWHESKFSLTEMPGRSARLLKLTPERKRK